MDGPRWPAGPLIGSTPGGLSRRASPSPLAHSGRRSRTRQHRHQLRSSSPRYLGSDLLSARKSSPGLLYLVSRFFECMPHQLLFVTRHLSRAELIGQLVDLAGEAERQLVAVV